MPSLWKVLELQTTWRLIFQETVKQLHQGHKALSSCCMFQSPQPFWHPSSSKIHLLSASFVSFFPASPDSVCTRKVFRNQTEDDSYCDCHVECTEEKYELSLSTSNWPSNQYVVKFIQNWSMHFFWNIADNLIGGFRGFCRLWLKSLMDSQQHKWKVTVMN